MPKLRYAYYSKTSDNPDVQHIKQWLTLFFSLSYLKPEDVPSAFGKLQSITPPHEECKKFANYVKKNYIDSTSYPPTLWACPLTECVPKTTNAVESYNSKLQMEFYHSHPNIHAVVGSIKQNQSMIKLKINSVLQKETFQRRPQQIKLEENIIIATHAYYTYKYLNTLQFLQVVGDEKKLFPFKQPKNSKENDPAAFENDLDISPDDPDWRSPDDPIYLDL